MSSSVFVGRSIAPLALLLAACATPFSASRWYHVETEHFELISSASSERSTEIAIGLERFRAALAVTSAGANLEPRIPTLVVVFGDAETYARFRPRTGVAGFMLQRPHRNFVVVDGSHPDEALAVAYHEYVHFILRNGGAVRYPPWYDEGFAEFLGSLRVEGEQVHIGRIPPDRGRWILYGSLVSLRRILTASDVRSWSDRALERFYAQSWALTHFLYLGHRQGHAARYEALARYLRLSNRGVDPESACLQAFGETIEELEQDFLHYVGEGKMAFFKLPISRLSVSQAHRIEPLADHEKAYLLGDLAFELGVDWHAEADRWLRLAVESAPQKGRPRAALGRLRARAGGEHVDGYLDEALALGPDDPEVHRIYAEALLDRLPALSSPWPEERVDEARAHFRRSIDLDPEQVAAYAGLGRSYLTWMSGDAHEGLEALETAHARLPADRSIGLALALLRARAGSVAAARSLLVQIPPRPHGDPVDPAESGELAESLRKAGLDPVSEHGARFLDRRLDLERPGPSEHLRAIAPLVEVSGQAGLWESAYHDVVLAIDESGSTLEPTGSDVDGDGIVGERTGRRFSWDADAYATDPGDSIIRAELAAARALVGQLDPRTTRVAIVTFADRARVRAPLGPPEAALAAIDAYEVHVQPGGTSLAAAVVGALDEFVARKDLDTRRQRTVLLLSDGQPTLPTESKGKQAALELANQLGSFGIPVYAFALGEAALEDPEFYRSIADRSGGEFVPVERPSELLNVLPDVRFTGLERVTIRNLRTQEDGRAIRTFPDGSFDGYVSLVPGENSIEVTAHLDGAPPLSERRTVSFERPAEPSEVEQETARTLLEELARRTVEVELLDEIRRRRRASQSKALEVDVDEETTPSPGPNGSGEKAPSGRGASIGPQAPTSTKAAQ